MLIFAIMKKRYSSVLRMNLIFFILTITTNVVLIAQTTFQRTYGGNFDDEALCTQQTADQGYIMCGYSKSFNNNANKDAYVVKTDGNGNVQWASTYGGVQDQQLHFIVQTNDGGYIATGFTANTVNGTSINDIFILRLDGNGIILWTRNLGTIGHDVGYSIRQLNDGNFIVAGVVNGNVDGDAYVAKIDNSGSVIWESIFGDGVNSASNQDFGDVRELPNGDIICIGSSNGQNNLGPHNGSASHDAIIARLDQNGTLLNSFETGGDRNDGIRSLVVSPTGDLFVAGNSFDNNNAPNISSAYFSRITSDLTATSTVWITLAGKAANNLRCWSMNFTNNNELISALAYNAITPNSDAHLLLLDASGAQVWSKTYGGPAGDEVKFCNQTQDGGYVAAGYTASYSAGGDRDMYLLKTDANGDIQNLNCPLIAFNPIISSPAFITATELMTTENLLRLEVVANNNQTPANVVTNITCQSTCTIVVNSETICSGSSANLTASGADTYAWSPSTGLNATTGTFVTATPTVTTTYTITGTASCGTGTAISIVTVLNPSPVSVNSSTVCLGSSATLTASGADTYSWSPATGLNTTTGTSVTATPTVTTTYTITGTSSCGASTTVSTVTVIIPPTVTVNSQTICSGSSANFTASGADTYAWSDGSTSASLTASPASTTSYTVVGTTAGCTGTAVFTITVLFLDDPSFSYTPTTICKTGGTDPTPIITGLPGGAFTATAGLVINSSTGIVDLAASPPGAYTVTYTTTNCINSSSVLINIVNIPVADFTLGVYCQNVANPSPTFINGGSAGIFTAPVGLVFISSTTGQVNLPASTPSTYVVTNTIAAIGACPEVFATSTITINAVPVITVNSQTVCAGTPATLTAIGGSANYVWSDGSTASSLTATNPVGITSYTVNNTTAGCSSSAVGTITVNPIPVTTVNSQAICEGVSTTLTAASAANYAWSDGSSLSTLTASPTSGITSYTVTGTTAGCSSSAVGTITVNPLPVITVNSVTICAGETAVLTANSTISGTTFSWAPGGAGDSSISVNPTVPTVYSVTGSTPANCTAAAAGNVFAYPVPIADFDISPVPAVVSYPTITFTNQSSPDVNYWSWNFGDGDSLAPNTPSPVHTYPQVEATYVVTLNVLNAGLCPAAMIKQVVIGPEYSFFIPNAFSPDNNDGINDVFFGKGKGIIEYELMIFDRWGNFIFYADDINKTWNGKVNGGVEVAQQDVYVWKVNLVDVFKKKHSFIGTVTIVK